MSPQQRRGDGRDSNARDSNRSSSNRGSSNRSSSRSDSSRSDSSRGDRGSSGGSGAGGSATGGRKPHRGQAGKPAGTGRPGAGGGKAGGKGGGKTGGKPRGAGAGSRGGAPARATSRPRADVVPVDVHDPDGIRLQKVLATAGMGSRRACEDLIASGRVEVDGQVVLELGVRVDPKKAVVLVDGMRVQLDTSHVTIALNKPKGVVSTMHDPEGRPSVAQFVKDRSERLFHVGRLDADTEGLLLLTSDGELANHLSHPSHAVAKTYLAEVQGKVTPGLAARLQKGIELDDGPVKPDSVTIVQALSHASLVEIVIHEGRNRIVRRMFAAVDHPVTKLVRTRIGPIRLGDLKQGRTRVLSQVEIGSLMTQAGM
ncbi:rRNA pseudouridine synthase [Cellulomonas sp. DKR-3]|uniref:Pseudouridine synthase n=1 Tax=Cellulomonas fulva TaxID=2835530 RepID=A0ABS5U107_9CELL|nr:pseudouridine synthase [Cellulomonas fulva]MBT0995078.1 rRNA pseudouridine synthase [Cellulomonas fulva]